MRPDASRKGRDWTEIIAAVAGPAPFDARASRWTLHRALVMAAFGLTVLASLLFAGGDLTRLIRPEVVPFLVSVALVAPLALRERPWAYLLAGIGVVLLPAVVLYETGAGELLHPAATIGFVSNLLLLAAIIVGLPSGLYGYAATRKGARLAPLRRALRTRHGHLALATIAALLGASVTSLIAGGHAGGAGIAGDGAGFDVRPSATITLAAADDAFAPADVSLRAGEPTAIVLTNGDTILHRLDYTVDGTTYVHEVFPGGKTRFIVLFQAAGGVPFVCKFHKGMVGTFRVA